MAKTTELPNLKRLLRISRQFHAKLSLARETVKRAKSRLGASGAKGDTAREARAIVQRVAERYQQRVHDELAAVVARCLQDVFDRPYDFEIRFERKRGKTEAKLVFIRDGLELEAEDIGQGVVDVGSFALRVAIILRHRPPLRRFDVLDEAFKWVSEKKEYREKVRVLLETLAKELRMQIVQVTHDTALIAGKVVSV